MKKIILSLVALTALSSNATADMMNSPFYLRGDILGTKFNTVNIGSDQYKEKHNASVDFGLGLSVMDNIRTELVYTHVFPAIYKRSTNNTIKGYSKAYIESVMVRGIIDVADLDLAKIFTGVGIGYSRVRHTLVDGINARQNSKYKHNFAFNALLGTSFELTSNTNLEVGYLYADYGSTKGFKKSVKQGKIGLRSHNVFLGIRHEL